MGFGLDSKTDDLMIFKSKTFSAPIRKRFLVGSIIFCVEI